MPDSGPKHVQLKHDGESVVGAFRGDPLPVTVYWANHRLTYRKPSDRPSQASQRFAINFVSLGQPQARIAEGNATWFKRLVQLRQDYDLNTWLFRVTRRDGSRDQKTTFDITPERELDSEERDAITQADLIDLPSWHEVESAPIDWDEPIDEETALELIEVLRPLPRPFVDVFLRYYRIQRVRELRAADTFFGRLFAGALKHHVESLPEGSLELGHFRRWGPQA